MARKTSSQQDRKEEGRRHPSDPQTVIKLVERRRDEELVRQLQQMLSDAVAGNIIGMVAAVHYGGREYSYIGTGSMCEHPNMGIAAAHRLATKLLHANS